MSAEDDVRKASKQFYTALTRLVNGEAGPMAEIWSHGGDASAMHPIGGRNLGWSEVEESWRQVARLASEGHVDLGDQVIQVLGDVAYELGVEQGRSRLANRDLTFENRVTNIYRREAGGWKIVHHHADLSPAMVEVVQKNQS